MKREMIPGKVETYTQMRNLDAIALTAESSTIRSCAECFRDAKMCAVDTVCLLYTSDAADE